MIRGQIAVGDGHREFAGHRGDALVQRCHLSSSFYHASWGKASVRRYGECRPYLGFDVPCLVTNLRRFEGDAMITDRYDVGGGMCVGGYMLVDTYGTMCEIPFSFFTGAVAPGNLAIAAKTSGCNSRMSRQSFKRHGASLVGGRPGAHSSAGPFSFRAISEGQRTRQTQSADATRAVSSRTTSDGVSSASESSATFTGTMSPIRAYGSV